MSLPYVEPAARARLSDVRERLAGLRKHQTQLRDQINDAKKAIDVNGSAQDITQTPEFQRVQSMQRDQRDLELKISSVQDEESYLVSRMAGLEGWGIGRETFLQDPSSMEELRLLGNSTETPIGNKMLGTYRSRDQLLADFERMRNMAATGDVVSPGSDTWRSDFQGIVQPLLRNLSTIFDFIPTAETDGNVVPFVQEQFTTPAAAETAELALKPAATITYVDQSAPVRTIPVWAGASRQQLADVNGLGQRLQELLTWDVLRRLQDQIISGNGVGQNLLGIANTTGIGAPASGAPDSVNADLVAHGARDIELSNGAAQCILMNPADFWKALLVKASGSGQRLDSAGAFSTPPTDMWGLPVVRSSAVASGTAYVCDFQRGATLFVREGVTARISDSDGSDFTQNRIKILLEGRWAFVCWRPAMFSKVTLSFAA